MFIQRWGKGERAFLGLHGWGGTHTTYAPLAPYLPDDASLYAVDLPGSGRTPRPAVRAWDLQTIAEGLSEAAAQIDAPQFTLIGNCSGGIVALAAMPLLAARVNRLVLIDPFAYVPWYFWMLTAPALGELSYYSTFANPLGRWVTNLSLKKHRAAETDLTATFGGVDHPAAHRYLRLFTRVTDPERFAWIQQPIDILHGARTFGAVRTSLPIWQRVWPRARVFELAGAGHLPIREATQELSRIIFRGEV